MAPDAAITYGRRRPNRTGRKAGHGHWTWQTATSRAIVACEVVRYMTPRYTRGLVWNWRRSPSWYTHTGRSEAACVLAGDPPRRRSAARRSRGS